MNIKTVECPAEAELVAALAREIWTEYYTPLIGAEQVEYMLTRYQSAEAIWQSISEQDCRYDLFYDSEGRPVAYSGVRLESEDKLFLSKLYVLKDARGLGAARALLYRAFQNYPGAKLVYLTVNRGNAGAIAAYQRMGFALARTAVTDIGQGFVMDDYVMEKPLPDASFQR